jgi:DNA polymerase III delta' subunit
MASEVMKAGRLKNFLKMAFAKDRVPHALLVCGAKGALRSEAMEDFAQTILCENKRSGEPCGICRSCGAVLKRIHPDFFLLEPAEDSMVIKIDAVRELLARATLKPLLSHAKVFVIENAESMNEASQNALLKTLEEPPGKTHFLLLASDAAGLLKTIRSRCQTLNLETAGGFLPRASAEPVLEKQMLEFVVNDCDFSNVPELGGLEREELGILLENVVAALRDSCMASQNLSQQSKLMEKMGLLAEFREKILAHVQLKIALNVLWDRLKKIHDAE